MPKEIGNLTNLEELDLSSEVPTIIPREIGNLHKLKFFDMHSGCCNCDSDCKKKGQFLPKEICNLTSLIELNLSNNGLERLPENMGKLKNLKVLDLFGNNLKYLPRSIEKMDSLRYLNVYDNFKLIESYKMYLPRILRNKKKTT